MRGDYRALLIGSGRGAKVAEPDLNGCANDVHLIATVLKQRGFAPESMTLLVDEAASHSAIERELAAIARTSTPATTVVFFFAGRAVRIPLAGLGAADATANEDCESALVPYDWDPSLDAVAAIRLGELRAWLAALTARNVVVIIDALYGGSLLRPETPSPHRIYLGSARPGETAYRFTTTDGVFHGVLTYFLGHELRRAEPGVTYQQLFQRAREQIASRFPHQHPIVEGDVGESLFDAQQMDGPRVATRAPDGHVVKLDVGAAGGVTVQSVWSVFAGEATGSSEKLGTIEISAVSPSEASARILSEARDRVIDAGCRLFEEEHRYAGMILGFAITSDLPDRDRIAGLIARVEGATLLRVVPVAEGPDIYVRLGAEGMLSEWATTRTSLDEPKWNIEDNRGRAVMPPVAADDYVGVRDCLEKVARCRNVLSLNNLNPRNTLAYAVELRLKRWSSDAWEVLETGLPILYDRDRVAFEIVNHHTQTIYANLFDISPTRSISALSQDPSGWPIAPQQSFTVGGALPLRLRLPRGFEGATAIETVKLFASVYPTDLSNLLLQDGFRSLGASRSGGSTELSQLIDMALTGYGARDRRSVRLPPEQEWISVQRTFELRGR